MKKYRVQIFLVVLIVVLVFLKMRYGYDELSVESYKVYKEESMLIETITPTKSIDPEYPLWQLLPYSGKGFVIDRYAEPLMLVVKIKGIDQKIVEKEVWNWLELEGVASDSHKLVWE